jgi:hypothetical protein
LRKKLLLYIHADTLSTYRHWKANPQAANQMAEVSMLSLVDELLTQDPAAYYESFTDASDVLASLKRNLLNEIYASLRDQEAQNRDRAEYLMEKILTAAPEIRAQIQEQLNPDLLDQLQRLTNDRDDIVKRLSDTEQNSQTAIATLRQEKDLLDGQIGALHAQSQSAQVALTMAAVRDARWLQFVRTTMIPPQPGRVPFHNSAEVAMRGYHAAAGGRKIPVLKEVTWSKLPERESKLHRGYKAGLLFRGVEFVPGVVWTSRRRGETTPPTGNADYFWHLPNTYFGDYLEVSTGEDEIEGPLSYRDYEFQCKNPEGQTSEWITFSYPFNDGTLLEIMRQSAEKGRKLVTEGKNRDAVEPLRKAIVFSDRILGISAPETIALRSEWNQALDRATLDGLRFPVGTTVKIVTGEHAGCSGIIKSLGLRQIRPYWIATEKAGLVAAADHEVEEVAG